MERQLSLPLKLIHRDDDSSDSEETHMERQLSLPPKLIWNYDDFFHPRETREERLLPLRSISKCPLSDPAQPHELSLLLSNLLHFTCFSCKGKHLAYGMYYFHCATCNLEFHRGCHKYLPEIQHPFHSSHPLTFIVMKSDFRSCGSSSEEFYDEKSDSRDGNHRKCKCCRKPLKTLYYHCSICKFNLNAKCSTHPPPPTILHFKSHDHTLTLFPMSLLPLPCDVCGLSLDKTIDHVYTCFPCTYMVHRNCIYLPRVIKITRHRHRLTLTSSLPLGDFSCGVCRHTIDVNYGEYSCKNECHYAVHSKCATRDDVWDGKDLEGEPEEEEEEDIEPFMRIDEETIKHFSHEHFLRLQEKKNNIHERDKFCVAYTLPIKFSQKFYGCTCKECDFFLDEACASLPLKTYHPLHKHPLALHIFPTGHIIEDVNLPTEGMFRCDGCYRHSCGFVYECGEKSCNFQLDVICASLPDPIIHGCHLHDHPLFFNLTKGNCNGCGSDECSSYFLECIKCKFFLGLRCATLPSLAHYKHDKHPLTLCYGEEDTTISQYWCEICESKLDLTTWFYACEFCNITLHFNCLLGGDVYMKPHHIFKTVYGGYKFEIDRNDGNSRLFCSICEFRCWQAVVFKSLFKKVFKRVDHYRNCCSFICVQDFILERLDDEGSDPVYMYKY